VHPSSSSLSSEPKAVRALSGRHTLPLAGLCGLFIVLGSLLIPYAGIQNDEALFASPIYQKQFEFSVRILRHDVPLMVMSYIGTLKTALYFFIFKFAPPSLFSIRLPMVIAGALTVWAFFALTRRLCGSTAAWFSAVLLATDALFLLTNTFDWGPVALEHLLFMSGCAVLVRSAQTELVNGQSRNTTRDLALGFFLLGLALWNKAIFLWALSGASVATLFVCWREVLKLASKRNVAIALCAFLLGTSPFLIYNWKKPNATLGSNAHFENPNWYNKFLQISLGLDGTTLFGYIVSEEGPNANPVSSTPGHVAQWIHEHFGEHRHGGLYWTFLACLAAIPLWWRSRVARFCLLFLCVAWVEMAITKDAGGSAHHAVLLWPFPHLFVAATLGRIRPVVLGGVVVAALAVSNLLVINQYLYQFERDGAGQFYTDALNRIPGVVAAMAPERLYITDWGIVNSLAMFPHGPTQLLMCDGPFQSDSPDPGQIQDRDRAFADARGVFIGHPEGQDIFEGSRARLERAAAAAGLRKDMLQVIPDVNGRPRFEAFRLVPATTGAEAK
jgi:4-amino-4-deoxy-L-arabinose transferase-like glycosyltransferase